MSTENESGGRGIPVKLPVFEGPLDLLLHLIEKNKIDIYDIPIVTITDQYMEYVRRMDDSDLGVMSDFLVMAATLLQIKAKMLLPAGENEDQPEADPREELVTRLEEYKKYRELAKELRKNEETAALAFYREADIPEEVAAYEPLKNPKDLVGDLAPGRLCEVFMDVLKRAEDKTDPVRSGFGDIEREEVSLEERILYVEECIKRDKKTDFRTLLCGSGRADKIQVVVTFLAVLELMKAGRLKARQDEAFGEIYLEAGDI